MERKLWVGGMLLLLGMLVPVPASAESKWNGFTLAPKLGYAWYAETSAISDLKTDDRHSFNLQLDLDFGGVGAGFDLAPYFAYEEGEESGTEGIKALGLYAGFAYRMEFGNWYPYVGFGAKIGYGFADGVDHLAEIYGRVPIGCTYYLLDDLGVLLELGLGYGVTGLQLSGGGVGAPDDFQMGHGFYLDLMAGVRWP